MSADTHVPGPLRVWALVDERAGNRGQCLGVAEALGLGFEVRDLAYTAAAAMPNFVIGGSFVGLDADSRVHLAPPWPDLVVAAGRRTAPVARRIKELNRAGTFLVQLMYPGDSGAGDFDLIAAPAHDAVADRPNLIRTTGAPHRITPEVLEEAGGRWRDRFADLPRPWIALIVGGSTRRRRFTDAMARELGAEASRMAAAAGGSLLVSTSRRTGAEADGLVAEIAVPSHRYRWGDGGDNPYLGYLGAADGVIVTGDSVSMCTEACAVPNPVYIYAPEALISAKHARLHAELYGNGYARPLGEPFESWTHPPLNPANDVAEEVRRRMGL